MANTKTTTSRFTARKRAAALALALGAGVVGSGYAAGVITFDQQAEHGFGAGNTTLSSQQIDITGQLKIDRPQTINAPTSLKGAEATLADYYEISGFDALTNAEGATVHIYTTTNSGAPKLQESLEVTPGLTARVPATAKSIDVVLEK